MRDQFLEAYDQYANAIYRHCYFRVNSHELAQDLMQDTFTKAWKSISEGKEVDNLQAFLYGIAKNTIIDHYRKRKESSLDQMQEAGFDPSSSDHENFAITTDAKRMIEMIQSLTDQCNQLLMLRYVEDLGPADISQIINKTENATSVAINRCLKKLRDLINNA